MTLRTRLRAYATLPRFAWNLARLAMRDPRRFGIVDAALWKIRAIRERADLTPAERDRETQAAIHAMGCDFCDGLPIAALTPEARALLYKEDR